jgi:hypothetical protein
MMQFKKAVKAKQRLRLAIDGVSGSGKTYTALAIASGMGNKVAVIDSEHGSAALYGDRFDFDTLELESFQIEDYVGALEMAAAAEYPIVIIDSTSHAWDALIERVERIATQKFNGNTFRGWGEGTPLQKKLIEAMLNYPGHVIVTCRSKTEYSVDKDDKGKTTVKKVGTAAVQRQGFEYEFTMAMTMDANHVGFVTKDRTSKFQDKFIEKPGKEFGKELIAWLNEGVPLLAPQIKQKKHELWKIMKSLNEAGIPIYTEKEVNDVIAGVKALENYPEDKQLLAIEEILKYQTASLFQRLGQPPASPAVPALTAEERPPMQPGYITPPNAASQARAVTAPDSDIPSKYDEEEPPEDDYDEESEIPPDDPESPVDGYDEESEVPGIDPAGEDQVSDLFEKIRDQHIADLKKEMTDIVSPEEDIS